MQKIWDVFWSGWLNKFITPFRFVLNSMYVMEIRKCAKGKILEIGCGSSYCSRKLNTYGLDISKKVAAYRNRGKFVIGDVKKLPFKTNSFNLVWSAGLLEHFIPPDEVIKESRRVGKIVIAFIPSNLEPLAKLEKYYGKMKIYSEKSFYRLFKRFFDDVEVKRFNLIVIMGIGSK